MVTRTIFLVLSFLTSAGLYSQVLDINPSPTPLKFLETSFYPEFKKPMKKFIWIDINDTLDIYYFDKKGNEEIRYNYNNNKPRSKTLTKYTNGLKTETVFITSYDEETTRFKYDAKKRMIEWGKTRKFKDPKINEHAEDGNFSWTFEYDAAGKLVKKYYVNGKKEKELHVQYVYDKSKRLTEALFKQNRIEFEYMKGALTKKAQLYIPEKKYTHVAEYSYDERGQLIKESNQAYTLVYSYDDGLVKRCVYTYLPDSSYEEVDFFYDNKTLSKVEIKRSGTYSLSPFIFKMDYIPMNRKRFMNLRMEFIYDRYKNIKEVKYFGNEEYKYSRVFVYEYY